MGLTKARSSLSVRCRRGRVSCCFVKGWQWLLGGGQVGRCNVISHLLISFPGYHFNYQPTAVIYYDPTITANRVANYSVCLNVEWITYERVSCETSPGSIPVGESVVFVVSWPWPPLVCRACLFISCPRADFVCTRSRQCRNGHVHAPERCHHQTA